MRTLAAIACSALLLLAACRQDQQTDNLGALDLALPVEATARLEAATGFEAGFPTDFIAETSAWVFGDASLDLDTAQRR